MSANDQTVTQKGIENATEVIKEILRSPAAEVFFKPNMEKTSLEKLLISHEAISRYFSRIERESDGGLYNIEDFRQDT